MTNPITLEELGITEDPGTMWHPRDKGGIRNPEGELVDLSDDQVSEHLEKPERDDQVDGAEVLDCGVVV